MAFHASGGRSALEVRTATIPAGPTSVIHEIDYKLRNVVSPEADGLPAFEGGLTLVVECVTNARR